MQGLAWIGLTLIVVVMTDIGIKQWAKANGQPDSRPQVRVFGVYSPTLTLLRYQHWPKVRLAQGLQAIRRQGALVVELSLIVFWGVWVARPYLNMDAAVWPSGADFARNIQPFFEWHLLPQCGACVFWNGTLNGGAPAFADTFTPALYPPMMLATLLWGAINGAKITLVLSFILAGLGQWWLAQVLGLGRVARLWSSLMAVAGGQLSGRMQMGQIVMVTSIGAASLVLAPALQTALTGGRRTAIVFGVMMALALVAGQGYMQVGLLLGVLPALLVFVFDDKLRIRTRIVKAFLLAAGITVLLGAVYWLPLIHFWGHLSRQVDPTFAGAQPVLFALMNLVINDVDYFNMAVLGRKTIPALYIAYISWVPIALVVVASLPAARRKAKVLAFFILAILLIYFASSAELFKQLSNYGVLVGLGSYPSLMAPLAVPLILGLAAWGLDELLKRNWPRISLSISADGAIHIPLAIILVVPLAWGLWSVYQFGQSWITTTVYADQDFPTQEFRPDTSQWVTVPGGDPNYVPKALAAGLKIIVPSDFTPWSWTDRAAPPAFRELTRDPAHATDPSYKATVNGVLMFERPENQYASVQTATGSVPCTAVALGGNIDVNCQATAAGTLTVQENMWPGWTATIGSGAALALSAGPRLTVSLPAGTNHIAFRYRPWDVTIGLLLTVLGLVLAVWLWLRPGLGRHDDDNGAATAATTAAAPDANP